MESKQVYRAPSGRTVGSILLALVVGALLPIAAVFQISLLIPVLMLGGILTVFFYSAAGWVPAGVFVAVQLGATGWFFGPTLMAMDLAAAVLPAVLLIPGIRGTRPFFDQMRASLLLYFGGMVGAVVIAYVSFGGSTIQHFMDVMRQQFRYIPDAALAPFVEAVNSALSMEGSQTFSGISISDYRASLMGVLDLMQQTYGQMLPGALLSGALVSAVLTVLWGNWRMAMRGIATTRSFVGMTGWFLPAHVTLGMLVLWVVSYALAQGGISSGGAVYATVHQLASFTFLFQALSAMDRRYLDQGMSFKWRRFLIGFTLFASLVFRDLATVLMIVGICSALFGRRGTMRRLMARNDGGKGDSGPDDPDT